jgi:hypothetical protein
MRGLRIAIGWTLVLVIAAPVAAQLLPAGEWQNYGPSERYEALRNYRRHEKLPRDEQRAVEKHYQRWKQLPEDERERIRRNYERYRDLPQNERDQFERKYRAWKRERKE